MPTTIDKATVRLITDEALAALQAVAAKHDLTVTPAGGSYVGDVVAKRELAGWHKVRVHVGTTEDGESYQRGDDLIHRAADAVLWTLARVVRVSDNDHHWQAIATYPTFDDAAAAAGSG